MNLLFIGDIFGRPGRQAVKRLLPALIEAEQVDFVVANGENAAGGKGLTAEIAAELFSAGVHVITGGNHTFANREIHHLLHTDPRVLRPANYPEGRDIPGAGSGLYESPAGFPVGVINLLGRVSLNHYDCPFRAADALAARLRRQTPVLLVDFHAEATSEKVGLGWFLDGRVTAVIGTHTHIQTADETILPGGTAYLTDSGMTGPYDSIIGVKKEIALAAMMTLMPQRFEPASGDVRLCGALIECDPLTGRALSIRRVNQPAP